MSLVRPAQLQQTVKPMQQLAQLGHDGPFNGTPFGSYLNQALQSALHHDIRILQAIAGQGADDGGTLRNLAAGNIPQGPQSDAAEAGSHQMPSCSASRR